MIKERIFASQVTKDMDGKTVVLAGWVHVKRDLGGKKFLVLRDKSGTIQLIIDKKTSSKEVLEAFEEATRESVIIVRGKVKASPKAPRGVEVAPEEIKIISKAKAPLPLDVTGKVPADIDTRLQARIMDLRRAEMQAVFRIQDVALQAIRRTLRSMGFIEVFTPKIIAAATEGGAQLFPVIYFGKEAFLAQSPQLYKELLTSAFERVFEIGPAFRAEESDTPYHLAEFISVDIEAAFMDYKDVMEVLEAVVKSTIDEVQKKCSEELEVLKHTLPEIPSRIPRITYEEAIDILKRKGVETNFGDDIGTPELRVLYKELEEPLYFITDWPTSTRPFYTKPRDDRPELSESFDLVFKWIEVASGSTRVHDKDLLVARLRDQGLAPENFEFFLKWFDYGMPPHAGWGLGFARYMLLLTGRSSVKEVVLFPRDKKRLVP